MPQGAHQTLTTRDPSEQRDIIETGLEENDANVMLASTEIMTVADGLGEQVREYRKGSDRDETW